MMIRVPIEAAYASVVVGVFALIGAFMHTQPTIGGAAINDRSLWDYWCQRATWTEITRNIDDDPVAAPTGTAVFNERQDFYRPKVRTVTMSQFFKAAQLQNPTSGTILCDDGTKISAHDGHKL